MELGFNVSNYTTPVNQNTGTANSQTAVDSSTQSNFEAALNNAQNNPAETSDVEGAYSGASESSTGAQEATGGDYQQALLGADLNQDGDVTREELDTVIEAGPAGVERSFSAADANQDDILTGDEKTPFIQSFLPPELANDQPTIDLVDAAFDTNADGAIDRSEVNAQIGGGSQLLNDAFAAADTNNDNVADAAEIAALTAATSSSAIVTDEAA